MPRSDGSGALGMRSKQGVWTPTRPLAARTAKRGLDLVLGSVLAIGALPLILMSALIATVALRSWPLFSQRRIGRGGRLFTLVKVRTLPSSTPRYCDKYDLDDLQVPSFTKHLRRLHLDELPQLFLVLTGKMALVGPRPEMGMLHTTMDPVAAAERTAVRPGCTGLWQVSAASAGLIHEAPQYDRYYVEHQTTRLDVWILIKTFQVMVLGGPKVTLSSVPEWTVRPVLSRAGDLRSETALGNIVD